MSTTKGSKINRLLQSQPKGVVYTASWLSDIGYSLDLQRRYKQSGWFESIGYGALKRKGEEIQIAGAIYSLQTQLKYHVHFGAYTALSLLGLSHYLELNDENMVTIFGTPDDKLPKWFVDYKWAQSFSFHRTSFLPSELGLVFYSANGFSLQISSAARAMMECLYLCQSSEDLIMAYEQMQGLNNLRPANIQYLLEQCNSVKVKRLFLLFAELSGHSWLSYLERDKIDLGKGKRSLAPNGDFYPKYQITVPKGLRS